MSDVRPVLAFVDPGRRKAAFLTELSRTLSNEFRCVFYSRRAIPRGILRKGRVDLYPGWWCREVPPRGPAVAPELLRTAVGAKARAKLGRRVDDLAPRYLADLERFLDRNRVGAIFVWNGATLVSSLAVHLAGRRQLPVVFAEHGYLPGTMQLDRCGVNFDSSATAAVAAGTAFLPHCPAVDARLDQLIADYRAGRPLRNFTAAPPEHLRYDLLTYAVRELKLWRKRRVRGRTPPIGVHDLEPLPENFVLLPFQVAKDTQLLSHSPVVGNDMAGFLRTVHDALRVRHPDVRIVCKLHPYENARAQLGYAALIREFPDVQFRYKASVKELIERSAAVVTINSTVGFEALLLDKPVVALGRNFYVAPGVVEVVSESSQLPAQLERALTVPPDRERRRGLLRYVVSEFLTFGSYDDCSERSLRAVGDRIAGLLKAA